jgi:hypothetical protein
MMHGRPFGRTNGDIRIADDSLAEKNMTFFRMDVFLCCLCVREIHMSDGAKKSIIQMG